MSVTQALESTMYCTQVAMIRPEKKPHRREYKSLPMKYTPIAPRTPKIAEGNLAANSPTPNTR